MVAQMPASRRKLRVVLVRRGAQWVASVRGEPDLTASGHNTRTARRLVAALIRERHGEIEFEVEIALSKAQRGALDKYRKDEGMLRSLAESVPRERIRWVEDLLALHLSQGEVADILGITRGHLAVSLMRATQGRAHNHTPKRANHRAAPAARKQESAKPRAS